MDMLIQPQRSATVVPSRAHGAAAMAAYGGLIAGGFGLLLIIRRYGQSLAAPVVATAAARSAPAADPNVGVLWHLLVALASVILVGRFLGACFRRIGQPPVMGEVIGGIVLGPSVLGAVSPAAFHFILAPTVMPYLGVVAQLGVVLYMFLVGLELQPDRVRGRLHATIAISHVSIVVPFVLGAALALYLYPRFSAADVPFTSFSLFLGIAMSITAFPVLARILSDFQLTATSLGSVALACAAVDDVTAWCLLALVVGVVQATPATAAKVVALTLGFSGVMLYIVGPKIGALLRGLPRQPTRGDVAVAFVGLLVAATMTEAIGIHALFGAFLCGVIIPHDSALGRTLSDSLDHVVTILLLPAFFAYSGMRTQIGLLSGWEPWLVCGLIVAVATIGKVGGTLVAGRTSGLTWRTSAALGVLMNTRGLMQLIVLTLGLDLGILTPTMFTMMVVMAIVTTLGTAPALQWLIAADLAPAVSEREAASFVET
jgi:Kef-type K+ transport system membrane component KefB